MKEGDLIKRIDQRCNELVSDRGIEGLSIAIVNEGQIAWQQGYGVRNKERTSGTGGITTILFIHSCWEIGKNKGE
ncbi:MAG: hypothetical protein GF308_09560 [Candidatus Heimdallarchaeota archaeon]|nr:hypothetical protein [Candidatus Heimdallarchaeota archaeon]